MILKNTVNQNTGDISGSKLSRINTNVNNSILDKRIVMSKKSLYAVLSVSSASFILSFISICRSFPRSGEYLSFDYLGLTVGILGLIVAVVVGKQLIDILHYERTIKEIRRDICMVEEKCDELYHCVLVHKDADMVKNDLYALSALLRHAIYSLNDTEVCNLFYKCAVKIRIYSGYKDTEKECEYIAERVLDSLEHNLIFASSPNLGTLYKVNSPHIREFFNHIAEDRKESFINLYKLIFQS